MPDRIQVVPEDLHVSAGTVDGHAQDLHARHIAAHGRIAAAQVGVPATSAVALSAALAKWETDTEILHGNLIAHGGELRGAAQGYSTTEQHNAASVQSVGL